MVAIMIDLCDDLSIVLSLAVSPQATALTATRVNWYCLRDFICLEHQATRLIQQKLCQASP